MMKKKKLTVLFLSILLFGLYQFSLFPEVLPVPTDENSLFFSWTYQLPEPPSTEVNYIKSQFGKGLYAPLMFSTFKEINMDWKLNPSDASIGIQDFKDSLDELIARAKIYKVGIHLTMIYGLARSPNLYRNSKIEDLRNAQWFSDNNPASQDQLEGKVTSSSSSYNGVGEDFYKLNGVESVRDDEISSSQGSIGVNEYVWGTFSRYARKIRNHLEAKVRAVFDYIKLKQDQNPDVRIIISAPGEAELSYHRMNTDKILQNVFCDYSPFAVLEFRDWITHDGMYGPGGKYDGEGFENGGERYRGTTGLANFNRDFGTSFSSWSLKYFNWSLSDKVDADYSDNVNPDPNIIPFSKYTYDGLMPKSGSSYIAGGFDPPRTMKFKGENAFWDLWETFREMLVSHYVKDMASIAKESGIIPSRYYTHQIPADYLFGTRPNDPNIQLNQRFYTSASPLSTANAFPDMGMGATIYDINFIQWTVRTTQYAVPALSESSKNWAAMEFNPEIILTDNPNDIQSVNVIYPEIMRLYNYNAHIISFFYWDGKLVYKFKDTNREKAAKKFFNAIKDKARQPVSTIFIPPAVNVLNAGFSKASHSVILSWSPSIWEGLQYEWSDWGDFKEFIVYRGETEDFQCNASTEIARVKTFNYEDKTFSKEGVTFYYKLVASNIKGETGAAVTSGGILIIPKGIPILEVSRTQMYFGGTEVRNTDDSIRTGQEEQNRFTASQLLRMMNKGEGILQWSISGSVEWLRFSKTSGTGDGDINVFANLEGKTPGAYHGNITISSTNALVSSITVPITLTVYEAGKDNTPFGVVETPENGSTVQGAIPVNGWALDDTGIETVNIYAMEGNNRVYIGEAVFIEGIRPEVESYYPNYPDSNRAGWGYMLLTHFLPNKGNGPTEIIVIAKDTSGNETILGAKTFTCDNAHSIKPFGTIDSPLPGETVSGTNYINWGWTLTPSPASIVSDGSTIDVYIDNIKVGHPVYNVFREDIAQLFPGYSNTNGAAGYFSFDTTKYQNGLHTISWVVTDSMGHTEGIGSRYFYIMNN